MNLTRIVHLFLIGFICVCSQLVVGCEKKEEQTEKVEIEKKLSKSSIQRGGTYRYPLMNNPSTLDPASVKDQYGEAVVHQLFDGLVRFDSYLAVLPSLAESWNVENNGTTYRFVLRKNAKFHNGRPVTTDDVVFSISRLLRIDPPPVIVPHILKIVGAKDYKDQTNDRIVGIEPIDDRIFKIRLEVPHAPFLAALGMYQAAIIPKGEVVRLGELFSQNPIGSGPFRFVSWEGDKSIRLERFSNYHSGEPLLDGIDYIIFPGFAIEDAFMNFQEGKLEEMPVYGKIREKLSTLSELQWFQRPSFNLLFYGINCNHPLLKNPNIRKALSIAIDREKLIKEAYKGQFEPARTILPPGMPGYQHKRKTVVEDIARAQELIRKALADGAGSLPPLEIVSVSQSTFAKAELSFISETWKQLGLSVEIKFITDWKAFTEYRLSDSVQIYRASWAADMPDPDSFLHPLFASDSSVNYMRYHNEEVDRMLQNALGITDPLKRVEMYQQIEEIIVESSPIIPIVFISVDRVYQPYVQDIKISALGSHTMPLNQVWLKKPATTQ